MTGLIVAAIVGFVAWIDEKHPSIIQAASYSILCGGMALVCCAAVIMLRRMPKRRVIPTEKNIEQCIRTWLDNHRIAITKDPSAPTHFRYRIELPVDGEMMTVLRMKEEHPEYVQVLADLGLRGELQKKVLEEFNTQELNQLMFDIKLELARLRIAYSGLVIPAENFMIYKKVPIHSGLTETEFMSAVFEVEAGMHIVMLMFIKARNSKGSITPQIQPTSDSPKPALPAKA